MTYELIHGDCLEVMRDMAAESVDAIVCDPPYELGFMGKRWDSSGVAYNVEVWRAALAVLKPGGYLLAFGGTRTYHRMACAIEDAGFEIRDMIEWLYGSGFPKGRSCLKPAHEPIVMARKGRGRELNIEDCRIGIDPADDIHGKNPHTITKGGGIASTGLRANLYEIPAGRWPANLALDEVAAAMLDEMSGESTSRRAARGGTSPAPMSWGESRSDGDKIAGHSDSGGASRFFYVAKASRSERNAGLEGMPERGPDAHNLSSNACGVCGLRVKANRSGQKCECGPDRVTIKLPGAPNHHPTVKPIALMDWLIRLVTPPGGTVLDPFMGSGTTGIAAIRAGYGFIGIEQNEDYVEIARARIAAVTSQLALAL